MVIFGLMFIFNIMVISGLMVLNIQPSVFCSAFRIGRGLKALPHPTPFKSILCFQIFLTTTRLLFISWARSTTLVVRCFTGATCRAGQSLSCSQAWGSWHLNWTWAWGKGWVHQVWPRFNLCRGQVWDEAENLGRHLGLGFFFSFGFQVQ